MKIECLCEFFVQGVASFQQRQCGVPLFDGESCDPALDTLESVACGALIEVQPRLLLVVPASPSDFRFESNGRAVHGYGEVVGAVDSFKYVDHTGVLADVPDALCLSDAPVLEKHAFRGHVGVNLGPCAWVSCDTSCGPKVPQAVFEGGRFVWRE